MKHLLKCVARTIGSLFLARPMCMVGLVVLMGIGVSARASVPQCYLYNGSAYCDYTGLVASAYVNSADAILLYFDTPVDPNTLASVGISGVSMYNAAIYYTSANQNFGNRLYATLLSAQASGATVHVQMWGVVDGYLQMDRIWVSP